MLQAQSPSPCSKIPNTVQSYSWTASSTWNIALVLYLTLANTYSVLALNTKHTCYCKLYFTQKNNSYICYELFLIVCQILKSQFNFSVMLKMCPEEKSHANCTWFHILKLHVFSLVPRYDLGVGWVNCEVWELLKQPLINDPISWTVYFFRVLLEVRNSDFRNLYPNSPQKRTPGAQVFF